MEQSTFTWKDLGDIELGRPTLGSMTSVLMYRLMQFTLRDTINTHLGKEKGDELMYQAGELAGLELYQNALSSKDLKELVGKLTGLLKDLNIGIFNVERADAEKSEFVFTVSEDLDCSGLPDTGEKKCQFDEGLIAGILKGFLKREVTVEEVSCWGKGDKTCRFSIKPK